MIVVSTTMSEERIPGTVTLRNLSHAFAPSSDAASICSVGTALIAAERITIANPVCVQMKTMSRQIVLTSGVVSSQEIGLPPNSVTIAFSRPI